MVTKVLDFNIKVQCQSDVLSESLVIMVNSTALNSTFNATVNQTGYDISVQCIWTVNGGTYMNETTLNGKIKSFLFPTFIIKLYYLAPISPMLNESEIVSHLTSTSIDVSWTAIPDANGYVVYVNDTVYDVIGSDISITVDGLIPGTSYSVTVRGYQDILGPPSMTYVTTDDGEYVYVA